MPNGNANGSTNVDDDMVPEAHYLRFPPFPSLDSGNGIKPFDEYEVRGISVPSLPSATATDESLRTGLDGWVDAVTKHGTDSHGNALATLPAAGPSSMAKLAPGRVALEDSWKIASDPDWVDPAPKYSMNNDIARPPFSRLEATLAFYDSRFEAFQNPSTKYLWNLCRATLGLSRDLSLLHWPGTGPGAMPYEPTQTARRRVSREGLAEEGSVGESCCLLRDTEKAVRGMLAMARRETDGMWGIERTLLFIDIVASFIAYINFHGVITDDYLAPRFARAEKLARSAALATKRAKDVEDIITTVDGLNQASWVMYGGTYLDRQAPATEEQPAEDDGDNDDGGWTKPATSSSIVPTVTEARHALERILAPVAVNSVKQINYMPFSRRRVVSVHPPEPNASGPQFMKTHYRLRTVPSPWTDEEQWRDYRRRKEDEDVEEEEAGAALFEKEEATLPEPDELDIWIDATGLDTSTDWMLGLGFRARWAEVSDGTHSWWILKLKDFVLPGFWKSTEAEREAAAQDPPAPYPAKATRPDASTATGAAANATTTT